MVLLREMGLNLFGIIGPYVRAPEESVAMKVGDRMTGRCSLQTQDGCRRCVHGMRTRKEIGTHKGGKVLQCTRGWDEIAVQHSIVKKSESKGGWWCKKTCAIM